MDRPVMPEEHQKPLIDTAVGFMENNESFTKDEVFAAVRAVPELIVYSDDILREGVDNIFKLLLNIKFLGELPDGSFEKRKLNPPDEPEATVIEERDGH